MNDILQPSLLQVPPPPGPPAAPDLVTISRPGGLGAAINLLGAELWWLRDGAGRDVLWDGNPQIWAGRAPILFPIVGRLRDDTYRIDGQPYHLPRHGFARQSRFALAETGEDHVLLRLEDDVTTRRAYPFAFSLSLRFAIAENRLTIAVEVANRDVRAIPVSFGFHPALRWPLAVARADHRITFDESESGPISPIGAGGLLAPGEASPIADRVLPLSDELFGQDGLVLPGLASRGLTYGAPCGPAVRIESRNLPDLGLWSRPGADFAVIGPWQGYNDPEDFRGDIFQKPGILALPPGEVWKADIALALEP